MDIFRARFTRTQTLAVGVPLSGIALTVAFSALPWIDRLVALAFGGLVLIAAALWGDIGFRLSSMWRRLIGWGVAVVLIHLGVVTLSVSPTDVALTCNRGDFVPESEELARVDQVLFLNERGPIRKLSSDLRNI